MIMKLVIGGVIAVAVVFVYVLLLSPFIIAGRCSRLEEDMRARGELPGNDKPE